MLRQRKGLGWTVLAAGLLSLTAAGAKAGEGIPPVEKVRIGMVATLFRDLPDAMVAIMGQPFSVLIGSQTGLSGELVRATDASTLGQQLANDQVHLGVFHGVEFAWVRQKHPELRPLMIAVNQNRHLRAHLIVRADHPAGTWADLKGQPLALPRRSREHCHQFVNRPCREYGQAPQEFFSKLITPPTAEEALDDVVDGIVAAAVVDGVALECYQRRKPGRFAQLKTAQQSQVFPASVIAYRPGVIEDAMLERFRAGMLNANQTILGKQMLTLWRLTGFEPIPADYEQTLVEIIRAYPPPANGSK